MAKKSIKVHTGMGVDFLFAFVRDMLTISRPGTTYLFLMDKVLLLKMLLRRTLRKTADESSVAFKFRYYRKCLKVGRKNGRLTG